MEILDASGRDVWGGLIRSSFFSKNVSCSSDVLRRDSLGDRVFDSNTRISAGTSILEFIEPSKLFVADVDDEVWRQSVDNSRLIRVSYVSTKKSLI